MPARSSKKPPSNKYRRMERLIDAHNQKVKKKNANRPGWSDKKEQRPKVQRAIRKGAY